MDDQVIFELIPAVEDAVAYLRKKKEILLEMYFVQHSHTLFNVNFKKLKDLSGPLKFTDPNEAHEVHG